MPSAESRLLASSTSKEARDPPIDSDPEVRPSDPPKGEAALLPPSLTAVTRRGDAAAGPAVDSSKQAPLSSVTNK